VFNDSRSLQKNKYETKGISLMSYIYLIAGLAMLVIAGDALVRGAVSLAVRLNIPHLIIGLTIVAFGTSAPELLISIRSALQGFPGLAVGNVVGSNIANIWLVLGVPALISAINCDQKYIKRNLIFMIVTSVVLMALCYKQPLSLWHGAILVALLLIFLFDCMYRVKDHKSESDVIDDDVEELIESAQESTDQHSGKMIALLVLGLIGLAIGAELTVTGAIEVARTFGVSEVTIGLTVVAIGTSLPELAATVMAAIRSQPGIALGNAIGSNIYNIGAVLGITALIIPIEVDPVFMKFDLWVMLAASLTIMPFVFMKGKITKIVGLLFLLAYGAYLYKAVELGRVPLPEQTQITKQMISAA